MNSGARDAAQTGPLTPVRPVCMMNDSLGRRSVCRTPVERKSKTKVPEDGLCAAMRARLLLFFSACALEASSAPIGTTANPGRDVQFGPVPVLGDTASACPVPTWCAGGVAPFDSTIHLQNARAPE